MRAMRVCVVFLICFAGAIFSNDAAMGFVMGFINAGIMFNDHISSREAK